MYIINPRLQVVFQSVSSVPEVSVTVVASMHCVAQTLRISMDGFCDVARVAAASAAAAAAAADVLMCLSSA